MIGPSEREANYINMPVNWMLVSFLSLPWRKQLKYFPVPPLRRGDENYSTPSKNILNQLARSIIIYVNFEDDFDDEEVDDLAVEIGRVVWRAWSKNLEFETLECFAFGEDWEIIRNLARKLLKKLDLGFFDPPVPIYFDYFIENVDPDDLIV